MCEGSVSPGLASSSDAARMYAPFICVPRAVAEGEAQVDNGVTARARTEQGQMRLPIERHVCACVNACAAGHRPAHTAWSARKGCLCGGPVAATALCASEE